MCIGAVVVWPGGGGGGIGAVVVLGLGKRNEPGGGGGAERTDCDAGAPARNDALGGLEPFVCPSAPNAPESEAGAGAGVPAAGTGAETRFAEGGADDVRGGALRMSSMFACSAFRTSGDAAAGAGEEGSAAWSLSLLSLSKTCVASSSSSQSMSSWRPLDFGCAGTVAEEAAGDDASATGRVGAAEGAWLGPRAALGGLLPLGSGGGVLGSGGGLDGDDPRFGSEPRPGGGGGRDGVADVRSIGELADVGGVEGEVVDGSGGGADDGRLWLGGCAGPGIPISVFFMSAFGRAATWAPDPGGGGGAAGARPSLFFPRPSKISRSEPPLLSSDIRVS